MKLNVYGAIVEHPCGTNLYLGLTRSDVDRQIVGFVDNWWPLEFPEEAPPADEFERVETYFEKKDDEFVTHFDPQELEIPA